MLEMRSTLVAVMGSDRPDPGDYLVQLAPVVAQPDGVGPLTVG